MNRRFDLIWVLPLVFIWWGCGGKPEESSSARDALSPTLHSEKPEDGISKRPSPYVYRSAEGRLAPNRPEQYRSARFACAAGRHWLTCTEEFGEGLDFSAYLEDPIVSPSLAEGPADIGIELFRDGGRTCPVLVTYGADLQVIKSAQLHEINSVPARGYRSLERPSVTGGQCFAIRTSENLFAVLRIEDIKFAAERKRCQVAVSWCYQPDGTPVFLNPVFYGRGRIEGELLGFDFSEGHAVISRVRGGEPETTGDLFGGNWEADYLVTPAYSEGVGVADLGLRDYDRLIFSPEEIGLQPEAAVVEGHCYALRTREGAWAKVIILSYNPEEGEGGSGLVEFRYAYQPNGSTLF